MALILNLLIGILILVLVFYVVEWALGQIGLPPPVLNIIRIIFVLLVLLYVLGAVTGSVPVMFPLRSP